MSRIEIANRLQRFLEQTFPNPGVLLTASTPLLDEWFVDSLGILDTVLFLETQFSIDLSRADINAANFRSIESLSELVRRKLAS